MKKINLFILCSTVLLTSCAVRTGILVEVSDGSKPLLGEAVATIISGTFQVSNLDGLACDGTYDQYTQSRMLKTKVTCNDGRYGEVIILRTGTNLVNGSGEGRLNDGTAFRVLLGDMVHYRDAQGIWEKAK
ncbi:hypothetical protein LX59_00880 [Azomonas agilis]|uniref:Lipoprotein n=1 Tax=Azomonas agilis TaxID=116849 RepID=A0A562J1X3_9GAMM|nr:hypothetical protein [Azomonas agilis]TWH76835.1 hypothetical protein LX59_00880 [Azomonas agilis]